MDQKHSKNTLASSGGSQNRNSMNQRLTQKYGSKSEANSNKSGFSGMLANSYGGTGSQKTQTTAISNTATEGGNSGGGGHE